MPDNMNKRNKPYLKKVIKRVFLFYCATKVFDFAAVDSRVGSWRNAALERDGERGT